MILGAAIYHLLRAIVTVAVSDLGIRVDAAARDKPGHWGLRGIEERARRIHADARLHTAAGSGTAWRIEIRAALAYADGEARRRWPWRRWRSPKGGGVQAS